MRWPDGDALVAALRRERRLTRTHAALWATILLTTGMDVVLTLVGLEAGLAEGNLLVRAAVDAFGVAGLFAVKFAAMCWLVAGWALLTERNASIFLGLFAAVTAAVAGYNAVVLFG